MLILASGWVDEPYHLSALPHTVEVRVDGRMGTWAVLPCSIESPLFTPQLAPARRHCRQDTMSHTACRMLRRTYICTRVPEQVQRKPGLSWQRAGDRSQETAFACRACMAMLAMLFSGWLDGWWYWAVVAPTPCSC